MTIFEARKAYFNAVKKARTDFYDAIVKRVQELGFGNDVLVKRISDGKVGVIDIDIEYDGEVFIKFYPMKKDGTRSNVASGYISRLDEDFVNDYTAIGKAEEGVIDE